MAEETSYDDLTDAQKLAFLIDETTDPHFTDEQLGWLVSLYTVDDEFDIYSAAIHGARVKMNSDSFNVGDISIKVDKKAKYDAMIQQFESLKQAVNSTDSSVFNIHHIFTPNLIEL